MICDGVTYVSLPTMDFFFTLGPVNYSKSFRLRHLAFEEMQIAIVTHIYELFLDIS